MTTQLAKAIIKDALEQRNLRYTKLTAKTIHFTDLARTSQIFVIIHGWHPDPLWHDLDVIARTNGFLLDERRAA